MKKHILRIFKAGAHRDSNGHERIFTRDDLRVIAGLYNPDFSEAPLVIGHPIANSPTYGRVRGLRVSGDILEAVVDGVAPQFADSVNAGRYKKISASFFPPDHNLNPSPGAYYAAACRFFGGLPSRHQGIAERQFP